MAATAGSPPSAASHAMKASEANLDVSSPFKKHRASLDTIDASKFSSFGANEAANAQTPANPQSTNGNSISQTGGVSLEQGSQPAIDSDDDL